MDIVKSAIRIQNKPVALNNDIPESGKYRLAADSLALSSAHFRKYANILRPPSTVVALNCFTPSDRVNTTAFYSKFDRIFNRIPFTVLRCALSEISSEDIPDSLLVAGSPKYRALTRSDMRALSVLGKHFAWCVFSGTKFPIHIAREVAEFAIGGNLHNLDEYCSHDQEVIERIMAIRSGVISSGFTFGPDMPLFPEWISDLL
jgi:hypothetical protein